MPITYNIYTATASQTNFAIPFSYIDTTHIKVQINGTETSTFTVVGSNVVLDSGATVGDQVRLYRQTPGREASAKIMLVDFQDGSVLSEAELDKACQQLLFLAQEADETGASSLPVDWDGNYSAGAKRIKDLSTNVTADQDAATKAYVDGQTLYGGAVTLPQSWAYLGGDSGWSSLGSNNYQLTLTSPTPNSANSDLFVVSINGLTQRPTTDFTVTELGGAYILKILGWADKDSSDVINVMNFGAARNWIDQPLKGNTASDVALTVQRHTDGQSANLQEWVTEAASPVVLASVNEDGDAAFVDVTASGAAAVTGNTTVGGTLGVTGASTLSGGVSGNLNLLTGVLQQAGTQSLTVRQIVTATKGSGIATSGEAVDPGSVGYRVGYHITITPKSASSKLLFFGAGGIRVANMAINKNYYIAWFLTTGESANGNGGTSDGTRVTPNSWLVHANGDHSALGTPFHSLATQYILDSGNTDARTYNLVANLPYHSTGIELWGNPSDNAGWHDSTAAPDIHCIELG